MSVYHAILNEIIKKSSRTQLYRIIIALYVIAVLTFF